MTTTMLRTDRGRFAPGNPGGPGRPRRQTEATYLRVMMDACPPLEAWQEIIRSAVDAAKAGDHQARQWLASYLVGKPEGVAPKATEVMVQELLGIDALIQAAAEMIGAERVRQSLFPQVAEDEAVVRQVIEAAEAKAGEAQHPAS